MNSVLGPRSLPWTKERFFVRVSPEPMSGCWLWLGAQIKSTGYGGASLNGRSISAHRLSYLLWKGEIAPGLNVCHKCDVAICVNPEHLFLGTHTDNMRDASRKGRTLSGDRNPRRRHAKLTMERAREIRARWAAGGVMQKDMAAEYGVTPAAVCDVLHGRHWVEATS